MKASIVHGQGNLFGDAAEMNPARLIKTMGRRVCQADAH